MTSKEQGMPKYGFPTIIINLSMTKKFDLDERLIEFASTVIDISEPCQKHLPGIRLPGNYIFVKSIETAKNNNQGKK
jgi:hypothetical protein